MGLAYKYLMFKKLNLLPLGLTLDDLILRKDGVSESNFKEFNIENKDLLNANLAKILVFKIPPDKVNITTITAPGTRAHQDRWPVALNFYLTVGNERTWIWKIKDGVDASIVYNEHVNIFKYDDLEKVDSYVADQNDVYLLDTSAIHSVWKAENSAPRHILRFAWEKNTFDEILDSILPV
jgi:hypothetical protein